MVVMLSSSSLPWFRTAVNSHSGVRTPAGGIVTGKNRHLVDSCGISILCQVISTCIKYIHILCVCVYKYEYSVAVCQHAAMTTFLTNLIYLFLSQFHLFLYFFNFLVSISLLLLLQKSNFSACLCVCVRAGAIVLLSLAFLMPAFYYIPKACLAAVIICAVAPMVDLRVVTHMWRIRSTCWILKLKRLVRQAVIQLVKLYLQTANSNVCSSQRVCITPLFSVICLFDCSAFGTLSTELDLLPFTVTFLMSFWQIQYGIMGGVAVSGVLLLYNTARPQIKVAEGLKE